MYHSISTQSRCCSICGNLEVYQTVTKGDYFGSVTGLVNSKTYLDLEWNWTVPRRSEVCDVSEAAVVAAAAVVVACTV